MPRILIHDKIPMPAVSMVMEDLAQPSNVKPIDVTFLDIAKDVDTFLELQDGCKQSVSHKYILDNIGDHQLYFLQFEQLQFVRDVQGIILADYQPERKAFYIDVICSLTSGQNLMKAFFAYVKEKYPEITQILLDSIPNVLAYYPKLGFWYRKDCQKNKMISTKNKHYKRTVDYFKHLRESGKRIPTNLETYTTPEIARFMAELQNQGLAVKGESKPECGKKPEGMKWKQYMKLMHDNRCGANGYNMANCTFHGKKKSKKTKTKTKKKTRKND